MAADAATAPLPLLLLLALAARRQGAQRDGRHKVELARERIEPAHDGQPDAGQLVRGQRHPGGDGARAAQRRLEVTDRGAVAAQADQLAGQPRQPPALAPAAPAAAAAAVAAAPPAGGSGG